MYCPSNIGKHKLIVMHYPSCACMDRAIAVNCCVLVEVLGYGQPKEN